jgi:hypothetical protein
MVETLKHLFGCCGEGHPNLLVLFGLTPFVVFKNYIMNTCKIFILYLKSYLKQF